MKKAGFSTYKFGNLTVNVFTNEIVFIYIGKKSTYIRNIYKKSFFRLSRAFAMTIPVLLLTSVIITAFSSDGETADSVNMSAASVISAESLSPDDMADVEKDEEVLEKTGDLDSILEDEKRKNEILLSGETDFSAPGKEEPLRIHKHKVVRGENLSLIGKKYGVSVDTICGSNNLRSYDFIREGVTLRIPNKDGILYNMKKGGNIVNLAKKYKIPVEKILAQNSFKNSDFISVGELVFIPDAKPQNIIPGFMWPCRSRRITCGYGWRRNPFNRRYKEFHKGMDIGIRYGSIRATRYGKITYAGWMGGYGKAVIIAHPGGWKSLYGHLSRIYVRGGQYVKQGQVIARSGNTGRSTGPHLHFELIKQGRHINPRKRLKKR